MRIPLASDLVSRDGTTLKDARVQNGIVEVNGQTAVIRRRPGLTSLGSVGSGVSQILISWKNMLMAVIGNVFSKMSINYVSAGFLMDEYAVPTNVGESALGAASNGTTIIASDQYQHKIYRSADSGQTWATVKTTSVGFWGVAYGNGVYVAHYLTGVDDILYSSDDGLTWNAATSGLSSLRRGVFFGNGLFVLYGLDGAIAVSSNGSSWTTHVVTTTDDFNCGCFGGGLYVLGCVDGYIYTSPDASAWTKRTSSAVVDIANMMYGGGKYAAIDIDANVHTSANGIAWSNIGSITTIVGDGIALGGVYSNGNFFVADSDVGQVAYSSDAISWTNVLFGTAAGRMCICQTAGGVAMFGQDQIVVIATLDVPHYAASTDVTYPITFITPNQDLFSNVTGQASSSQYVTFKNSQEGFVVDAGGTVQKITDTDYPGWFANAVTSITRVGSTATVTTTASTNIKSGTSVTIAGAAQTEYNGSFVATVTGASTFTYTVTGTPATPATGTITATGGITTVPGVVFLDRTFYVMDEDGIIYGSDLNAPLSWNALNFITAQKEPGGGKAIAKSQNYIIAFKEWSTEFFYDAANPVGSPLGAVDNGFSLIGCASGHSVSDVDGTLFWVSQTKQKGRGVYMMVGLEQTSISTSDVERILNKDDLTSVAAYGLKISGHTFYVLTLPTSNITLAYDVKSKVWSTWSSSTIRSPISVTSITSSNGLATAITTLSHNINDGDPVLISGANQPEYNGIQQASYISATSFSYPVLGTPVTATGTITLNGYDLSYFKQTKYVYAKGRDLVMDSTNGLLYEITESANFDDAAPIDVDVRTVKVDSGSTNPKFNSKVEVIGNKVSEKAMIRFSDDDYTTYKPYRTVDLSASRSKIDRCGMFRRRAYQFRYVGESPIQISDLELDIEAN